MIKVLSVFGTRPEVIKMAPVIKAMTAKSDVFQSKVCVSAQHRQMLDPFMKLFGILADHDLNIMHDKQSLEYITSTVLSQMGYILEKEKPDYVLVQGDTTTSLSAALAAFYNRVKIVHVEAGLRTNDKNRPFPEEVNRRFIDEVSDLYFVSTQEAKRNLLAEKKDPAKIEVCGNTVIDALLDVADRIVDISHTPLAAIPFNKKVILVTAHRRENLGAPLERVCLAVKEIANQFRNDVAVVFPVHLNPAVQDKVHTHLDGIPNVFLIEPLDYVLFVQLMKRSYMILTDSGGIQEEAPSLGKPVLVLRELTERPEAVAVGATRLVGTDGRRIIEESVRLLENPDEYRKMSSVRNPYGDGQASQRILERLVKEKYA